MVNLIYFRTYINIMFEIPTHNKKSVIYSLFMTKPPERRNKATHLPLFCRGRRIRPCRRDNARTPRARLPRFRLHHLCFRFRLPPAADCSSVTSMATRPFGKWRWTGQAAPIRPPCRWFRSQLVDTRCASCPIRFLKYEKKGKKLITFNYIFL